MACRVCGHSEDTNIHAVIDFPLATTIWEGHGLATDVLTTKFCTLSNCTVKASEVMDNELFGDFLAVMLECWNARNRFTFRSPDSDLETLGKRAITFVCHYREHLFSDEDSKPATLANLWTPPSSGYMKLNFDGGSLGGIHACRGFVLRDQDGNVMLVGSKHARGFGGATVEEARACLHTLKRAYSHGCRHNIIEGDCLQLIQMLRTRSILDRLVDLFIKDTISFVENFELSS